MTTSDAIFLCVNMCVYCCVFILDSFERWNLLKMVIVVAGPCFHHIHTTRCIGMDFVKDNLILYWNWRKLVPDLDTHCRMQFHSDGFHS